MKIGRNGYGGYYIGKFNIYSSYDETDINGNTEEGYCWCIKEDLDSEDILLVSKNMEEIFDFCLDNQ